MPDQFVVPQFIDAEDKILGPITARQFVILLFAFMLGAILWQFLNFVWFLVVFIPLIAFAGIIAFVKINGQPFHYFFLNALQTLRKPQLRVWDKDRTNVELRALMQEAPPPPPPPAPRKLLGSTSRLQELALVANTGGVYKPEGET